MQKAKRQPKQDVHAEIVAGIARATGTTIPRGEDLLGSPELKRKFREAKASLGRKPSRK